MPSCHDILSNECLGRVQIQLRREDWHGEAGTRHGMRGSIPYTRSNRRQYFGPGYLAKSNFNRGAWRWQGDDWPLYETPSSRALRLNGDRLTTPSTSLALDARRCAAFFSPTLLCSPRISASPRLRSPSSFLVAVRACPRNPHCSASLASPSL
jgi:hypothetical protein